MALNVKTWYFLNLGGNVKHRCLHVRPLCWADDLFVNSKQSLLTQT